MIQWIPTRTMKKVAGDKSFLDKLHPDGSGGPVGPVSTSTLFGGELRYFDV